MKYKQLIKNDLGKERLNENFALQSITGSCVYLSVARNVRATLELYSL